MISRAIPFACALAIAALALQMPAAAQPHAPVSGFFDSDGVKIHYFERGEGEPVLLIHGYSASLDTNWRLPGVVERLVVEGFKVIALDNRGHGESDKPEGVENYGVKMVEDSIRLLDYLKIEKAHIVGYSMGGMITMKMLTIHPERMKSAVVGGMGWTHPRDRLDNLNLPEVNTALMSCRKSFGELGITEEALREIKTPFTCLVGENDGLYQSTVKPLMGIRPDVKVTMIPQANHTTACFKREFKDALVKFLREQSGSPTLQANAEVKGSGEVK